MNDRTKAKSVRQKSLLAGVLVFGLLTLLLSISFQYLVSRYNDKSVGLFDRSLLSYDMATSRLKLSSSYFEFANYRKAYLGAAMPLVTGTYEISETEDYLGKNLDVSWSKYLETTKKLYFIEQTEAVTSFIKNQATYNDPSYRERTSLINRQSGL